MIKGLALQAKISSTKLAACSSAQKNDALLRIAKSLLKNEKQIVEANKTDLERAKEEDVRAVLIKRLKFDSSKIKTVVEGINSLIELPDPVGHTLDATELDTGLKLFKISCPIGVLGIVFESRPDALVQISTLALKSGNAVILKGGSEAANTNRILAEIIYSATRTAGIPENWLTLLETRADVKQLLDLDKYVDLVIPRGSNEFVKYIKQNTRIAVLGHADGICHVYVDASADINKAIDIAYDSKVQYPAVCNAMETLLVNKNVAKKFLPEMQRNFVKAGVELRGDAETQKIIRCNVASEKDWYTEYNDLILSIKIVSNIQEAIDHINFYGSNHTDAIVTEDSHSAKKFMDLVDSANVFWNCSTRFSDGFRYGLGAEVGISTNKIHARGPVGLEGLIIYKWVMIGTGQTVAEYSEASGKKFKHIKLNKVSPF